jgi:hypothetical protein
VKGVEQPLVRSRRHNRPCVDPNRQRGRLLRSQSSESERPDCSTVDSVRILVLGAAGMLGRKLAERLARDGVLGDERVLDVSLVDMGEAGRPAGAGFGVETVVADLAEQGVADNLVTHGRSSTWRPCRWTPTSNS